MRCDPEQHVGVVPAPHWRRQGFPARGCALLVAFAIGGEASGDPLLAVQALHRSAVSVDLIKGFMRRKA